MSDSDDVLLPHGGYERLRSCKVAEAGYDATVVYLLKRQLESQGRQLQEKDGFTERL